ncbi:hypothetical protein ACQ86N_41125 [Puia sp. P3]|uniref:hypothetical protein n=1 Tax=Puia sp. P3 TaxID=3423952 RepID=UPI003D66AE08
MSSELMGGRRKGGEIPQDLTGYFLPVTAAVCMVLFVVFAFTEDRLITDKKAQLSYTLLLCTSLVYTNLQHGTHLPRRNDLQEVRYAELAYLRNQHVGDYQLFIMLDDAYGYYYNELKVLSPTPWLYQQFWVWYDNWDPDQRKLQGIAQDLQRHRTKYLLMNPADLGLMRNRTSAAWWLSFVHEHYEPVPVPGKTYTTLWQLKNTP